MLDEPDMKLRTRPPRAEGLNQRSRHDPEGEAVHGSDMLCPALVYWYIFGGDPQWVRPYTSPNGIPVY